MGTTILVGGKTTLPLWKMMEFVKYFFSQLNGTIKFMFQTNQLWNFKCSWPLMVPDTNPPSPNLLSSGWQRNVFDSPNVHIMWVYNMCKICIHDVHVHVYIMSIAIYLSIYLSIYIHIYIHIIVEYGRLYRNVSQNTYIITYVYIYNDNIYIYIHNYICIYI